MAPLAASVSQYMSSPVLTVPATASLAEVDARLAAHRVSALAVVDAQGGAVGVISRTDLLRAGHLDRAGSSPRQSLRLPEATVAEVMVRAPSTVEEDDPIHVAAKRMVDERIHRVFVTHGGKLTGVLSTRDIMDAIVDAGVKTPIAELATYSLIQVQATDPLSLALVRMEKAHKHGLVVVDDGWPVGILSQVDALAARTAPPETAVERVMNLSILMLPGSLSVARAAAQANALRVRRVLVLGEAGAQGILSGIDFARAAL